MTLFRYSSKGVRGWTALTPVLAVTECGEAQVSIDPQGLMKVTHMIGMRPGAPAHSSRPPGTQVRLSILPFPCELSSQAFASPCVVTHLCQSIHNLSYFHNDLVIALNPMEQACFRLLNVY